MNIPEKLNVIRQQLRQVKDLSGQAKQAFGQVEKGSEQAATALNAISNDVFEAGLSRQRWALGAAGRRSEERLGEVVTHHDQVVTDLDVLFDADPTIQEALYTAKREAESLGLPTNSTWLLRNAIDSAGREEHSASQATHEIDRSLTGMESELEGVLENATEVGKAPARHGYRHGYGRGERRERSCSSWGGNNFRERWQARIYEKRQRARELDETTSKLDNPFRDIDRSAERGARHQSEVADYADQALRWVDQLEQEYNSTVNKPKPKAVPSPVVQRPVPSPTAPLPVFETPPVPKATPKPPPPAEPVPKPEGFFSKPWRSKTT